MEERTNEGLEVSPKPLALSGDYDRSIVHEMETCYLDYAMSVIVQRALPDIRDGLKPVHRRILYSMYETGIRSTGKYKKSAHVVGNVLGKYHPHGDSSVYEAMVRMAQDFNLRYPLVDGQGNFGSMDGDSAAAMRYTEAKMSKLAEFMLADIDKDTVNFRDNYDASTQEPVVLPAQIPNLLLNGVMGIAVGMATNIPPHNLGELIDALEFIEQHESPETITIEDLLKFIKGPDFPTGGIIYNYQDILTAYSTGRGSIVLRGRASVEEVAGGRQAIIITEVPYQLNKSNLVIKMADLVRDKTIIGIHDIRDESNKESVRVVIELKKDAFPKKILNQLYKLTPLQTSFAYNMIALHENGMQPKLFNLLEILQEFLVHRKEVITRRTQYELKIAQARAHILEGLKIALDHIDEVIKTIRGAKDREEAHKLLMERFGLSDKQAQAIREMQLQVLSGLERKRIEDELAEKMLLIADLEDILSKPLRISSIIIEELELIRKKFSDDRRTEVRAEALGQISAADTIPNDDIVVTLSKGSYIKRIQSSAFRTQKRWGRGIQVAIKDEDAIQCVVSTKNLNKLLFFTSKGRVFSLFAYEIPETTRTAKGQPIVNLLSLQKDEEIAAILDVTNITGDFLCFITRQAVTKRLAMSEIQNIRSSGLIVIKMKEDDELLWVTATSGNDNILVVSSNGKAIQFDENNVRAMGRAASGVRAMRLSKDDRVVEASVVKDTDKFVFTITQKGFGKITDITEYREQGRGGSGVKVGSITDKTGKIVGVCVITEEVRKIGEILLISGMGQTIRLKVASIRPTSRVTQGVILSKLAQKNDTFISCSLMCNGSEEEDEENEATGENISNEE